MRKTILIAVLALVMSAGAVLASGADKPAPQKWGFDGLFGRYDGAGLKRGFIVYKQICSNCHGLKLVAYRNLQEIGLTEDEAKAIAAEYKLPAEPDDEGKTTDASGQPLMRDAKLSDRFVAPFPNEKAARSANNGALPPDLSLITKARPSGPDYLYALMTGYKDAPEGVTVADGMFYNTAFGGHQIAMAPPLMEGSVEYADGTKPTLEQHARDIVEFLNWAAEPELNARKSMGLKTLIFLIVLTAMFYALKRRIWSDVH